MSIDCQVATKLMGGNVNSTNVNIWKSNPSSRTLHDTAALGTGVKTKIGIIPFCGHFPSKTFRDERVFICFGTYCRITVSSSWLWQGVQADFLPPTNGRKCFLHTDREIMNLDDHLVPHPSFVVRTVVPRVQICMMSTTL